MSDEEYRTHLTLWVMSPRPLVLGNDIQQMTALIKTLLRNTEVMAIGQDPLGAKSRRVDVLAQAETWIKTLSDGATAMAFVNRGAMTAALKVKWVDIGLYHQQRVRDLWKQTTLGEFKDAYNVSVPAYGAVLLKVAPAPDKGQARQRSTHTRTRSMPP
jgi:alpha-galactosidase